MLLVLPPDDDPSEFDWSITKELGLLWVDAGPNPYFPRMDLLAAALLRDGADRVRVLYANRLTYVPPLEAAA